MLVPFGMQRGDIPPLTGILVTLKHHLRISSAGVPELNSPILRTTHNPVSIWRQTDTQNKILRSRSELSPFHDLTTAKTYLVTFESLHALATLYTTSR